MHSTIFSRKGQSDFFLFFLIVYIRSRYLWKARTNIYSSEAVSLLPTHGVPDSLPRGVYSSRETSANRTRSRATGRGRWHGEVAVLGALWSKGCCACKAQCMISSSAEKRGGGGECCVEHDTVAPAAYHVDTTDRQYAELLFFPLNCISVNRILSIECVQPNETETAIAWTAWPINF